MSKVKLVQREGIYQYALAMVENGAKFRVNLKKKSFWLNRKCIIKEGKYDGDLGVIKTPSHLSVLVLENLFTRYRHSVPTTSSEYGRHYFIALKESELSDDDMMYGEQRSVARFKLEFKLLAFLVNGSIRWENLRKDSDYFWYSEKYRDFVILRDWII